MLAYLDMNRLFILYTDSSETQIKGLLVQVNPSTNEVRTLSTFSWKLNMAQLNYPVMDKDLLGIMESLKHFHNIIYGTEILVNICHEEAQHTWQQVLWQWILISQEYGAKIEYYEGKK